MAKASPTDGDTLAELSGGYGTLNYLFSLYERPEEASNYSRLAMRTRERLVQVLDKSPATDKERDLLSFAYMNLGSTYAEDLKDLQTAEDNYDRALAVAEALVAEHPNYNLGWVRLAAANREIAEVRYKQGDYQGALDHFRVALRVVSDGTVRFTDGQMRGAQPGYMLRIAQCLYHTGHAVDGLQMLQDAAALNDRMSEFGSTEAATAKRNAGFLRAAGEVYALFGLKEKTLSSYREADELWKKVAAIEPQEQVEADSQIGRLHLLRGNLYAANRDGHEMARHEYQAAVEILSKLKARNEITLGGLNELRESQQKLQALAG
jgi:tetratricopeptide (TPR) repeat protein